MTAEPLAAPASDRVEAARAPRLSGRQLLRSGSVLGVATLVANAGNYVVNLLLGRWLSPAAFADATLMVTLWLTVSGVAMLLVLVTARYVGLDPDAPATRALLGRLLRLGWVTGAGLALLVAAAAPLWSRVFHTGSDWPFVVLAVGLPFHLALAVGRGTLQGRLDFGWLAASLLVEMAVRVSVSTGAVLLGAGATGATAGLSLALVASWALVRQRTGPAGPGTERLPAVVRGYLRWVAVLLLAQVVLSNVDLLAAKVFLPTGQAARYAAVALVGRGVFFVSWAAATVLFPAVARRHGSGAETRSLLRGGMTAVGLLGTLCAVGALGLGDRVLVRLLGPAYAGLGLALAAYAVVATLFALAYLVATHALSTGRATESWLMLAGAAVMTVGVLVASSSMAELIGVQLLVMTVLLVTVSISRTRSLRASSTASPTTNPRTSR